jgi:signal transduction histidine kinase
MSAIKQFNKLTHLIDRWLIHNRLKGALLSLRKARILVVMHLFLFLVSFLIDLSNNTLFPQEDAPPLKIAMAIAIALMVLFRWRGNFILSGNLLAFFLFLLLALSVNETGGIYSDNLLWMMAAPLLALLFANRLSGLLWLMALESFTLLLFWEETTATVSYREQIQQFDGLYYLISYGGLFIMVVGIVLIFATGQNLIIKALKQKQEELRRQKEEIFKQARSLQEAEEKLKASNQELETFAYAASHDLKEPLRMIGLYTQLVQRNLDDQSDRSTKEYMGFVTDGVTRMERLLNDLLEYSRLGRRKGEAKNINLEEVLFVVMSNLMATMRETKASIYCNQLPAVKATMTEMIQLFQNLISNAIKFRKKDILPVIEIIHSRQGNYHVIRIKDNGIGIPEEHRERVFNIFERLHSHTEYEGTGIGLATCKKIVNNLGGDIWVQPETTEGTTFFITIPCASQPDDAGKLEIPIVNLAEF